MILVNTFKYMHICPCLCALKYGEHYDGSDLGLEFTTSSLRQNSSWACFSATCSLPCINPQALIRIIS